MLLEKVRKYYNSDYKTNCAESMLYAANEEYNMNLCKETLKTMAAFGGGMGVESVCGAITGSLAVLSVLFTVNTGHESDRVRNLSKEFFQKFTAKLGTDNCAKLKETYFTNDDKCSFIVDTAAEILDEIVIRELLP